MIDRCALIAAGLALGAVGPAPAAGLRVVLLGTKGGPTLSPFRAAPATALVIDGRLFLVDCGNGVVQQIARAGIALPSLERIFVTHVHSDHVADLATLPLLAWASGLNTPVTIHGPPPVARIVRLGLEAVGRDLMKV